MDYPSPSYPSRSSSSRSSRSRSASPSGYRSESPPTIPGRFCRPLRSRSPSPVRFSPVYNNDSREVRPIEPLYPWKTATPAFEPHVRHFVPGEVKSLTDLLQDISKEEAVMANSFLEVIKTQHRAYCRRHAEHVRMMQDMERGMRRLEADPKDWVKLGFGKIAPMPMFLRDYCNSLEAKKD